MEKLKIVGNGPLNGDITVSGAKKCGAADFVRQPADRRHPAADQCAAAARCADHAKAAARHGRAGDDRQCHEYELTASDIHTPCKRRMSW